MIWGNRSWPTKLWTTLEGQRDRSDFMISRLDSQAPKPAIKPGGNTFIFRYCVERNLINHTCVQQF